MAPIRSAGGRVMATVNAISMLLLIALGGGSELSGIGAAIPLLLEGIDGERSASVREAEPPSVL